MNQEEENLRHFLFSEIAKVLIVCDGLFPDEKTQFINEAVNNIIKEFKQNK
jgi:hypothetical protein